MTPGEPTTCKLMDFGSFAVQSRQQSLRYSAAQALQRNLEQMAVPKRSSERKYCNSRSSSSATLIAQVWVRGARGNESDQGI